MPIGRAWILDDRQILPPRKANHVALLDHEHGAKDLQVRAVEVRHGREAVPLTIVLEMFPDKLLKLLYNTTSGVSYIRFLAPVCLLQYIQAPLASTLDALGMSKENFTSNLAGVLTRLVMLPLFSLTKIGMWGLIFSTSLNIAVVTMMNIKQVRKKLE